MRRRCPPFVSNTRDDRGIRPPTLAGRPSRPLRCEVVDSHRNYPPDEPDGQWYQQERGYPDPEWERRGGDPRYTPQQPEAPYAQPPVYNDPYRVPEPRGGYPPEGDAPYAAV